MALYSLDNIEHTKILRLTTGFPSLDRSFGVTSHGNIESYGMPCGRIVFASGEPGVGKTRFGIAVTKSVNNLGGKILVFQGEVRPQEFKQWTGSDILYPAKYLVSDDRSIAQMTVYIRQEKPTLIVIDSANMIDDYDKSSEIKGIMNDLKIAIAEVGAVCLMIGHLTKDGKMKGNSGVPHLVDVECSIVKVNTKNMHSWDGINFADQIRAGLTPQMYKVAMKTIESYEPSMFRYNIAKNRYGPSGGYALFHHTAEGAEFLDEGELIRRINGKMNGTVVSKGTKASSWSSWWRR